jgi:hypothetical protein
MQNKMFNHYCKMKKIITLIYALVTSVFVYGQNQVHVAWDNGGELITDAVAESEGADLKEAAPSRDLFSNSRGSVKPVSIVCTFNASDLKAIDSKEVAFEVKWFYYMSTRRSTMGTYTVLVDPNKCDSEGLVKMVCTKNNPQAGWWEVQVRNKNTGELVEFGKKTSFSILLK